MKKAQDDARDKPPAENGSTHKRNCKAPFGNAVGARLGQVSQVRVGLRFVKPGCGSNLASRFEA